MQPDGYGKYYWCVKTGLSKSGEIYVYADRVEFTATGDVIFWADPAGKRPLTANLTIAAGHWTAVFAASCLDGSAVAVMHWEGEVIRN